MDFLVFRNRVFQRMVALTAVIILASACNAGSHESAKSNSTHSEEKNPTRPEAEAKSIPQTLMVFAAASLTDVMTDMAAAFKKEKNIDIKLNLASSGTLARQMTQGELPDVFISASKKWADYVAEQGLTRKDFRKNVAVNDLVLIAPKDSALAPVDITRELDLVALTGSQRLSMGDPEHVPAGKYAKEALEYFGWYGGLKNKLLPAKDVRSALMVVELGEAPVGIVYRTDAQKSAKVKILGTFPDASHKPILYVATVCSPKAEAVAFFNFLESKDAQPIWEKYGFRK